MLVRNEWSGKFIIVDPKNCMIEEVQEFVGLSSRFFLLHLCHQFCKLSCFVPLISGRGRGDGGFVRQTSYEETRAEGGGGFGRGVDTRRQGWNENRLVVM